MNTIFSIQILLDQKKKCNRARKKHFFLHMTINSSFERTKSKQSNYDNKHVAFQSTIQS